MLKSEQGACFDHEQPEKTKEETIGTVMKPRK